MSYISLACINTCKKYALHLKKLNLQIILNSFYYLYGVFSDKKFFQGVLYNKYSYCFSLFNILHYPSAKHHFVVTICSIKCFNSYVEFCVLGIHWFCILEVHNLCLHRSHLNTQYKSCHNVKIPPFYFLCAVFSLAKNHAGDSTNTSSSVYKTFYLKLFLFISNLVKT